MTGERFGHFGRTSFFLEVERERKKRFLSVSSELHQEHDMHELVGVFKERGKADAQDSNELVLIDMNKIKEPKELNTLSNPLRTILHT